MDYLSLKLDTWIKEFGESNLNLDSLREYLNFIECQQENSELLGS